MPCRALRNSRIIADDDNVVPANGRGQRTHLNLPLALINGGFHRSILLSRCGSARVSAHPAVVGHPSRGDDRGDCKRAHQNAHWLSLPFLSAPRRKCAPETHSVYQKIENAVVNTYQKIEYTAVGAYKRVEDGFVQTFLTTGEEQTDTPSEEHE